MVLNDIDQDDIEEDLIESCLQCAKNIIGLTPSPIRQLQNNKHFWNVNLPENFSVAVLIFLTMILCSMSS